MLLVRKLALQERFLTLLVFAALVLSIDDCVHAGTIKLGFDAEVVAVNAIGYADYSGEITVGSMMHGVFEFAPLSGSPPDSAIGNQIVFTEAAASMTVSVGSRTVATRQLPSEVNYLLTNNIVSPAVSDGVIDEITASGLFHFDSGGAAGSTSGFRMTLVGDIDTVPSASLPSDAAIWNQFALFKKMSLSLGGEGDRRIVLFADINAFFLIPEPASGLLTSFGLVVVVASRDTHRRVALESEYLVCHGLRPWDSKTTDNDRRW